MCLTTIKDFMSIITPFIAFWLGIHGASLIDRKRAKLVVVGAIIEIENLILTKGNHQVTHAESIGFLKDRIFGAMGHLGCRSQEEARKAWNDYRGINFEDSTEHKSVSVVLEKPTHKDAVLKHLGRLRAAFK